MLYVGQKIWSIVDFSGYQKTRLNYPQQKKISQIVISKDGEVTYQVKGYHFSERLIGKVIFFDKESALNRIKENNEINKKQEEGSC